MLFRSRGILESPTPALRYWAAVWLGQLRDQSARPALAQRLHDDSGAVRVAAAESLYLLGDRTLALTELKSAVNHGTHNTALYAVRAWESIGAPTDELLPLIRKSPHANYDYIKRVADRLKPKRAKSAPKPLPPEKRD